MDYEKMYNKVESKAKMEMGDSLPHAMREAREGTDKMTFDLKDNMHAYEVKKVSSNAEQYDVKRLTPYRDGSRGYPGEAWNYKY